MQLLHSLSSHPHKQVRRSNLILFSLQGRHYRARRQSSVAQRRVPSRTELLMSSRIVIPRCRKDYPAFHYCLNTLDFATRWKSPCRTVPLSSIILSGRIRQPTRTQSKEGNTIPEVVYPTITKRLIHTIVAEPSIHLVHVQETVERQIDGQGSHCRMLWRHWYRRRRPPL